VAECIVCRGPVDEIGLLTRCLDQSCGAFRWDKSAAKKITKKLTGKEARTRQLQILDQAGFNEEDLAQWRRDHQSSVYVLRLRGGLDRVYVGMTGLHPVQRYLQHITGYKSSSIAASTRSGATSLRSASTQEDRSPTSPEYARCGFTALARWS